MKNKPLEGQISIFDLSDETKRKPCEYKFQRYIGQSVRDIWWGRIGKIIAIDSYYTDVECTDGEVYAWTPTNTVPFTFRREEWEPIKDKAIAWNTAKTYIPLIIPVIPSNPKNIDLVIDGTVDGKPALIGFKAWVSGPNDCFTQYEAVLYKTKEE